MDKNNHLSLKGLLKYLVQAASKHSDLVGYGLDDIPRTHLAWILLNWKVKIYNYPKTGDYLHIKTWASSYSKLYCFRDYEVLDNAGTPVAIGS